MATFKDDLSIVLCGEAGQGINTVEAVLVKLLKLSGYNVFASKEYMSRVRGGSNSTQLRVSSNRVSAPLERTDIFVPLDAGALEHLKDRITAETVIIGDKAELKADGRMLDVPFLKLSTELGNPVFSNVIAVGVLAAVCSIELSLLEELLKKQFMKKGEAVVSGNLKAAGLGYEKGRALVEAGTVRTEIKKNSYVNEDIIVNGAEAVSLGAVAGGCNFLSSYPMSPSTGVLTFISENAKRFGIVAEQAEDEIAAMNMTIGAWYAGARGMVTTSGGGFALMVEGVSLAGITESPLVVHLAQRPGPATGLPTRTEQSDLELALYAGHGEFPRIILAPGNLNDAFYLSGQAFNLADKYQVPVFILTDQYLMDSYYNNPIFDASKIKNENFVVKTGKDYKRYALTASGISPRGIPGYGEGFVGLDSDEHDEDGRITEDLGLRVKMEDKRRKKIEGLLNESIEPELFGPKDYEKLVICWGSTFEIIKEAAALSGDKSLAVLHFKQVYPLPPNTAQLINKAKQTVIVENNATAQFAKVLKLHANTDIKDKILKYDGLPFTVEETGRELKKVLKNG